MASGRADACGALAFLALGVAEAVFVGGFAAGGVAACFSAAAGVVLPGAALAGDFFAGGAFFSVSGEVLPGFPAFGTKRGFMGITLLTCDRS